MTSSKRIHKEGYCCPAADPTEGRRHRAASNDRYCTPLGLKWNSMMIIWLFPSYWLTIPLQFYDRGRRTSSDLWIIHSQKIKRLQGVFSIHMQIFNLKIKTKRGFNEA